LSVNIVNQNQRQIIHVTFGRGWVVDCLKALRKWHRSKA